MLASNCGVTEPIRAPGVKDIPVLQPDPAVETYAALLGPRALHLRISAHCDSECIYCERESWKRGDKEPEADMPIEVWEQVKAKFLDRVEGIEVAGLGEPMLAKTFPTIAKDVLARDKVFYFPTNGHFLTTKVADCLGDGTNVRVSVSMDAATPETYVAIGRGKKPSDFRKVVEGVKAFRQKRPNAFVHSQFTAGTYNIDEFPAFIDLCAEMGVHEVQFRFVHAHVVAREDVSLRFAKDRTESALASAQQKASDYGIALNIERRPYSKEQPNSASKTDPLSRLKRYLDFAPFGAPTCGGSTGSVSSPCSCSQVGGQILASNTTITSTVATAASQNILNQTCGVGVIYTGTTSYTLITITYVIYTGNDAQFWACPDSSTHTCYIGNGATYYRTDETFTAIWPVGCTCANNTSTYLTGVGGGPGSTLLSQSTSQSFGDCPPYFCAASEGGPEIVTTVQVPLTDLASGGFTAQSVEQPFRHADAAAIVWCDGRITSCFAEHVVGDVSKDDYDSLIRNRRYQAFMQRRQTGTNAGILTEPWCAHCPRVF